MSTQLGETSNGYRRYLIGEVGEIRPIREGESRSEFTINFLIDRTRLQFNEEIDGLLESGEVPAAMARVAAHTHMVSRYEGYDVEKQRRAITGDVLYFSRVSRVYTAAPGLAERCEAPDAASAASAAEEAFASLTSVVAADQYDSQAAQRHIETAMACSVKAGEALGGSPSVEMAMALGSAFPRHFDDVAEPAAPASVTAP